MILNGLENTSFEESIWQPVMPPFKTKFISLLFPFAFTKSFTLISLQHNSRIICQRSRLSSGYKTPMNRWEESERDSFRPYYDWSKDSSRSPVQFFNTDHNLTEMSRNKLLQHLSNHSKITFFLLWMLWIFWLVWEGFLFCLNGLKLSAY